MTSKRDLNKAAEQLARLCDDYGVSLSEALAAAQDELDSGHRRPTRDSHEKSNLEALEQALFPREMLRGATERMRRNPTDREGLTIYVMPRTKQILADLAPDFGYKGAGGIARLLVLAGFGALAHIGMLEDDTITAWANGEIR